MEASTSATPGATKLTGSDRIARVVLQVLPINLVYIGSVCVSISKYNSNGLIKTLLLVLDRWMDELAYIKCLIHDLVLGLGQVLIFGNTENSILVCLSIALAGPQELKGVFTSFVFMAHFELECQGGQVVNSLSTLPVLMLGTFTLLTRQFITSSPQDLIQEHSLASKKPITTERSEPSMVPLLATLDRTIGTCCLFLGKHLRREFLLLLIDWVFTAFAAGVVVVPILNLVLSADSLQGLLASGLHLLRYTYFWMVWVILLSNLASTFLQNISSKVKRL